MVCLGFSSDVQGAVSNWSGATDGNWNTGTNWDSVPVSATTTALVFDNANQLTTTNDIPGGLTLNSLTLTANSGIRTLIGNKLTFDGTTPFFTMQNSIGTSGVDDTTINTLVQMNQTLGITGGVDFDHQLVFSTTAVFSGTGGLNWNGGVGFISATNTYSGLTTIAGGLLGVNKNGAFGSSTGVTLQSGGVLQLQNTPAINKPLSLAGSGFSGLSALNGSGGGTKTWSGAITLASNASVGAFSSASLRINGTVALGANTLTVEPDAASGVSIFGAITGTGGLTKTDAGTLTLPSGANSVPTNTYSGATLVSGGKVVVQRNNAFGASSLVTLSPSAEIELRSRTNASGSPVGGATVSRPLLLGGKLSAGAPISDFDGSPELWSGAITLSGNSTLSASGAGPFFVPSTLQIGGNLALGGFTLNLAPDGSSSRHIVEITGGITGSGLVNITTDSGSVSLDGMGASTFTGPVSVNGNLSLGSGDNFGDPANTVTFTGGSLVTFTNFATIGARPFVITGAGGLAFVPGSFASTIGANISGTGPVQFTGIGIGSGGVITLAGSNTFTGGMVSGFATSVAFSSDSQLGAVGGPVTLDGGGLHGLVNTTFSNARVLTVTSNNGTLSTPDGVTLIMSNNIAGAGLLTFAGSAGGTPGGTIRLTGTSTQSGGTEIAGATLEAASDAQFGGPNGILNIGRPNGVSPLYGTLRALGNITVPATRTTTFQNATVDTNGFDVTFNQPMTGLHLTKDGAGVLRLNTANSNNSNDSNVAVLAGVLRLGIDNAVGPGRINLEVASGANFDFNNFNQRVKGLTGLGEVRLGSGTLTIQDNFGVSFDGVISGTGRVILDNAGTSIFGGDNSFNGGLTLRNASRLFLRSTSGLGAAGNAVTLDNGGLGSLFGSPGPLVIDASTNLIIGAGGGSFSASGVPLIIAAQLTGSAPISFNDGGDDYEVRLTHAANTFTGNVQLGSAQGFGSAVLGIVADGSLGDAANIVTLGDGFFDGESIRTAQGTLRAFANFTLPASRAIRLNGSTSEAGVFDTNGFNVTVESAITQLTPEMPLQKKGAGTLLLNGTSTFTGLTTVTAGTLGGNGTLSGPLRVSSDATLAPGTFSVSEVAFESGSHFAISNSGSLHCAGIAQLDGEVEITAPGGLTTPATFVILHQDLAGPPSGQFNHQGIPLGEGDHFSASGYDWQITYEGGDGNDVALTAIGIAQPPSFQINTFLLDTPPGNAPGRQVQMSLSGPPDTLFLLRASHDLLIWTTLTSLSTDAVGSALIDFTDPDATGPRRFYLLAVP